MQSAKDEVGNLLDHLPDDSTLEDIHYHRYVLDKIKRGEQSIADGKRYSAQEARDRLKRWYTTLSGGAML